MLKRRGHNVQILEQTPYDLDHQAAGIAVGPKFSTLFKGTDRSQRQLSLPAKGMVLVNKKDKSIFALSADRKLSSWDDIYYRLRWNFDRLRSKHYSNPPVESSSVRATA